MGLLERVKAIHAPWDERAAPQPTGRVEQPIDLSPARQPGTPGANGLLHYPQLSPIGFSAAGVSARPGNVSRWWAPGASSRHPRPVESQDDEPRDDEGGLPSVRRLGIILFRTLSLTVFSSGVALAMWAGVQWLQTGPWQPLTISQANPVRIHPGEEAHPMRPNCLCVCEQTATGHESHTHRHPEVREFPSWDRHARICANCECPHGVARPREG